MLHFWVLASIEAATQAPTAQSTAPSVGLPFDITSVLQFGLLGLIFLCLVFRKFVIPEWTLKQAEEQHEREIDDLQKRYDETREQLASLQAVFQDQMIPALTRATEINARYTDELQKARYVRKADREPEA